MARETSRLQDAARNRGDVDDIPLAHYPSGAPMTDVAARKLNWQQVGRVAKAGRYLFTFGWLTISEDDLAIWRTHPHAAFTLVPLPTTPDVPPEFHLGAFELRDNEKTDV